MSASTTLTADELLALAYRTAQACRDRQRRDNVREAEHRARHAALNASLDAAEKQLREAGREIDRLLSDWQAIDKIPAVRAAFEEGMTLVDAVHQAIADVHYAEGTPLFDAEVAKSEAQNALAEANETIEKMGNERRDNHEHIEALIRENAAERARYVAASEGLAKAAAQRDEACERAGWREFGEIAVLLGYARGAAEDFGELDIVELREVVSRLLLEDARLEKATKDALAVAMGRASPETLAAEVAKAEERGARWVLAAIAAKVANMEARGEGWGGTGWWRGCEERGDFDAARICAEARAKESR